MMPHLTLPMLDPAIGGLLLGSVVLLFATAAGHKLRDLQHFAAVFAGYQIASFVSRRGLVWLIPAVELLLAIGLLLPATRALAAALAAAVLLGYAAAIAINLHAGRRLVDCGCGAPDQRRPIAGWMVWRNVLLALLASLLLLPWTARPLQWTDAITLGGGWLTIALLYAACERLLGELGRTRVSGIHGTS